MAKQLRIHNDSRRRIVIGPGPKSDGKDRRKAIRFGTKDDAKVEAKKRIGSTRVIRGEDADALRQNRALKEVGPRLGLRIG